LRAMEGLPSNFNFEEISSSDFPQV